MAGRRVIAIEIGRAKLRAILATRDRRSLSVERVLVEDIPPHIAASPSGDQGQWVAGQLKAAGFPNGRATVALAREHVGLKRITLPSTDANELPLMTRLALQRELPFDAEQAVIDFVSVERTEQSTTVLAVAAPREVLMSTVATMRAAGLPIDRIALRAMGSAVIARSHDADRDSNTLAVDVTGDGVEFCVIERGHIRFSRAAELPDQKEAEIVAEAVLMETRRTWMSYRIVEGAGEIERLVLMGPESVTRLAAPPIAEMLKAEEMNLDLHPLITSRLERLDRVWPLAGLLLEPALGGETINFAHPRKAVDRAARKRKRMLLAAGIAVVALLGVWTVLHRDLASRRAEVEALTTTHSGLSLPYRQSQRNFALLKHLEHWRGSDVRWLDHLLFVQTVSPRAGELVLDSWTGTLDFRGVEYDSKERTWSAPKSVTIVIEGEAKDRATADALRERLVKAEWFTTRSIGTDAPGGRRLPFGFTYRLESTEAAPPTETVVNGADGARES